MPDVWGEVSGGLDRDQVTTAVATLPDAQREALELAYWAGLSQTEIAERLGVPLGTVKSRVRLALVALRRELAVEMARGAAMTRPPDPDLRRDPGPRAAVRHRRAGPGRDGRRPRAPRGLRRRARGDPRARRGATSLLETAEPAEPPAALKSRLMAAARPTSRRPPSVDAPTRPRPVPRRRRQPPRHRARPPRRPRRRSSTSPPTRPRRRSRFTRLLAAAAVIVAVALGGWNLALQRRAVDRRGVPHRRRPGPRPRGAARQRDGAAPPREDGSSSGFGVVGADGTVKLAMRGLAATTARRSTPPGRSPRGRRRCRWATSGGIRRGRRRPRRRPPPRPGRDRADPRAERRQQAPQGPVVASGVTRDPAG